MIAILGHDARPGASGQRLFGAGFALPVCLTLGSAGVTVGGWGPAPMLSRWMQQRRRGTRLPYFAAVGLVRLGSASRKGRGLQVSNLAAGMAPCPLLSRVLEAVFMASGRPFYLSGNEGYSMDKCRHHLIHRIK